MPEECLGHERQEVCVLDAMLSDCLFRLVQEPPPDTFVSPFCMDSQRTGERLCSVRVHSHASRDVVHRLLPQGNERSTHPRGLILATRLVSADRVFESARLP